MTRSKITPAILTLLASLSFTLLSPNVVRAERPACYELLPSKTLAYVRIADVKELVEKFDETSVGRMMHEQQLKSLSKQLFDEAEVAFQPAAERLGLTITELLQIPRGEITVAAVAPPNGWPAAVLMIDIDGQQDKVDKIWDLFDQTLESRMTKTIEEIHDIPVTVFAQEDPRWTGVVRFQKDAMQVVTTNLDVAKQILAAWNGDEEQLVLRDNEDFTNVMRHSKGPREATPQIRWFVDPISFAKVAFRGNLGAQTALAVLPVVGADGLLALGGSMTFGSDEYDSFVQAHVITAEPRTGALAMLALDTGDPTPEDWVPHDVASYQTVFWNIGATQKEFAKLYDSFRGDEAFERDFVAKSLERFEVDVVAEVMEAWGGRISLASWFQRPARIGGTAMLGGIKLKEDNDFESAFEKVIEQVGDDFEEKTFAGVKYYAMPPFGGVQPEEGEEGRLAIQPTQICFGLVGDYVLIANRADVFEQGLVARRDDESLEDELDYKLIASKLRRQPGGKAPGRLVFERPEESFRMLYDLATAENTRSMLASGAENNQLLGTLNRALEDNPLPPFSVLRKYFAPTGSIITSDETGFHYTGFGLRRK